MIYVVPGQVGVPVGVAQPMAPVAAMGSMDLPSVGELYFMLAVSTLVPLTVGAYAIVSAPDAHERKVAAAWVAPPVLGCVAFAAWAVWDAMTPKGLSK